MIGTIQGGPWELSSGKQIGFIINIADDGRDMTYVATSAVLYVGMWWP